MHPNVILSKELDEIIESTIITESPEFPKTVIKCKLNNANMNMTKIRGLVESEFNLSYAYWSKIPNIPLSLIVDTLSEDSIEINRLSIPDKNAAHEQHRSLDIDIIKVPSETSSGGESDYYLVMCLPTDKSAKDNFKFIDFSTIESILGYE